MKSNRSSLDENFAALPGSPPVLWRILEGEQDYSTTLADMENCARAIAADDAPEQVWLLEHPPVYTAGTSANASDLTEPDRFPVFQTGRGGQYTYHGPGQRVAYVLLDLKRRQQDVRAYVAALESWIISTLSAFGVQGERREDRVGVWVRRPTRPAPAGQIAEDKIAAIGVRITKWVSWHGISINVEPELSHFAGIVPCGVKEHGVTSLVDLGLPVTMTDLDIEMRRTFEDIFGPTEINPASATS